MRFKVVLKSDHVVMHGYLIYFDDFSLVVDLPHSFVPLWYNFDANFLVALLVSALYHLRVATAQPQELVYPLSLLLCLKLFQAV